jgi:hypothetical protein
MKPSTNELLLALRSPSSGWLAALICALDEASQDPAFSDHQRDLVRGLLDLGHVPQPVALAANSRLESFEETVKDLQTFLMDSTPVQVQPPVAPRPKLTVCGGTG